LLYSRVGAGATLKLFPRFRAGAESKGCNSTTLNYYNKKVLKNDQKQLFAKKSTNYAALVYSA
jgi:hypothetical protein